MALVGALLAAQVEEAHRNLVLLQMLSMLSTLDCSAGLNQGRAQQAPVEGSLENN